MKPFKNCYNAACSLWMRANPGMRINDYDFAKLVAYAYRQVCRLDIAENGFRCTEMFPTNSKIFSDLDFMSSEITNIPNQPLSTVTSEDTAVNASEVPVETSAANCPTSSSNSSSAMPHSSNTTLGDANAAMSSSKATSPPHPSNHEENALLSPVDVGLNPSGPNETQTLKKTSSPGATKIIKPDFSTVLKQVSPMLSCGEKRLTTRKRKPEKSESLTSTPIKDMLNAKKDEEEKKEAAKQAKTKIRFAKSQEQLKETIKNEKIGKNQDCTKKLELLIMTKSNLVHLQM